MASTQHPSFSSPFSNASKQDPTSSSWSNPASFNFAPVNPMPTSAAGRKRSRDEAAPNLEDDYFQQPTPTQENEENWEYGEGMVLIKPGGNGYIIPAGSQTGTWAEDKAEEESNSMPVTPIERPPMRAAKSQRLNFSTTPVIPEEAIGSAHTPPATYSPSNGQVEPTVDNFTLHLGVGWSSISQDIDIQAASRGWTKYINNHFPVTGAKIRLQSKGLESYLVEANEGYFLFGEDLKQGRLVSTSQEQTFVNLGGPIPIFEGETMDAGQTPKIEELIQTTPVTDVKDLEMNEAQASITNGTTNMTEATMEVEMDMS